MPNYGKFTNKNDKHFETNVDRNVNLTEVGTVSVCNSNGNVLVSSGIVY